MEINLFNCENADDITKYDNRFRGHKVRISNFHRIFSNAQKKQIKTFSDESIN